MKKHHILSILLIVAIFAACVNKQEKKEEIKKVAIVVDTTKVLCDGERVLVKNYRFIGDTLLHSKSYLVKYYFDIYNKDTCKTEKYINANLKEEFEGIKDIGDINNDNRKDSFFILPPLNQCEKGNSYYFTDLTLPRFETTENCNHNNYLINIGDIDEDGICELGYFHNSCVSRYKGIEVYTLKAKKWNLIGRCCYDIEYSSTNINLYKYIKKTGKGTFELLEITDLTNDKSKIGKKNWLKFNMN